MLVKLECCTIKGGFEIWENFSFIYQYFGNTKEEYEYSNKMLKYHFLLVSAALLFQIPVANAQIFEAVVVSVGDGDTIRVKSNTKNLTVRLGCIDAPEKKQSPWGLLATKRLKQLLRVGSKISLRSIGTDRYKRIVAEVYVNNRSINTNLVQEGHAVVYRHLLWCMRIINDNF